MRLINHEGKRRHVVHYLVSLRIMFDSIHMKQDRIARLRALAQGIGSALNESVSGGLPKDLADIQSEIDALCDEYASDLARYSKELAEGYCICPVEDVEKHACWLHWVDRLTWREVGVRLNYSGDYVKNHLSPKGIEKIYASMPNKWREESPQAL